MILEAGEAAHGEDELGADDSEDGITRIAKFDVNTAEMRRLSMMPSMIGGHRDGMLSRVL